MLLLEYKKHGSEVLKCYCKIIEKNDHYLFIDYPIEEKTRKTCYFRKGTNFSAIFIGKDQSVYQFRTELVSKANFKIPALALKLPQKEDIKRVQRREFVRIKSAVDIAVYASDDSFTPFTTVTNDLSGGGMSIILPKGTNLDHVESKKAVIWMVLEMNNGDYQYCYIKAEFVHIKEHLSGIQTASLKFTSITRNVQQQIIRYCFEKQREARKKELASL